MSRPSWTTLAPIVAAVALVPAWFAHPEGIVLGVLAVLQEEGVLPSSIDIPSADSPPGAWASALGIEVPDDFGRVVVYSSENDNLGDTLAAAVRAFFEADPAARHAAARRAADRVPWAKVVEPVAARLKALCAARGATA